MDTNQRETKTNRRWTQIYADQLAAKERKERKTEMALQAFSSREAVK